jgi:hypothetical protein
MLINRVLTFFIGGVRIVNGLFCKILNLVPRHQQIVSRILGDDLGPMLTKVIGISEILMAVWIISRIKPRFNALTQTLIIATMNILEFILVPDLLLWGRLNIVFAFCFIALILCNEFILRRKAA